MLSGFQVQIGGLEALANHHACARPGDRADGEGVHVVYDGSGPKTFQGSVEALRRSGVFCWYGPVLGGPGPLNIMSLPKSIKIGYAIFLDHIHTPELLRARSAQLFDWITGREAQGPDWW